MLSSRRCYKGPFGASLVRENEPVCRKWIDRKINRCVEGIAPRLQKKPGKSAVRRTGIGTDPPIASAELLSEVY